MCRLVPNTLVNPMKIDVGPRARIVGTKKVSSEGSVHGLRDVAGKNVLIVVPSQTPRVVATTRDLWVDAQANLKTQAKRAVGELRQLRREFEKRSAPATRTLLAQLPPPARAPVRRADQWIRATVRRLENRLGQWAN